SMVGWSTGTRMVAVDVAIAHRGSRDVAGGAMVACRRAGRGNKRPMPLLGAVEARRCVFGRDGARASSGRLGDRGRPAQSDGSRLDRSSAAGSSRAYPTNWLARLRRARVGRASGLRRDLICFRGVGGDVGKNAKIKEST